MFSLIVAALPAVTKIVGVVFRAVGPSAKARAGAGASAITAVTAWPLVDALLGGVFEGASPQVQQAGVYLGAFLAGWLAWLFGRFLTWVGPSND